MKNVWVIGGNGSSEEKRNLNNLICTARNLGEDVFITAAVFGKSAATVSEEADGADEVICIGLKGSPKFEAEICYGVIKDRHPWAVLVPYTAHYSQVGAVLAVKLEAGLSADCTGLRIRDSELIMHRPAFGGGVEADIRAVGSKVYMASVHPVPEYLCCAKRAPKRTVYDREIGFSDEITVLDRTLQEDPVRLSDCGVVVSGGAGVGSKEGFELLSELAKKLSGQLAGSRSAVDAGWISWDRQIGQTGNIIRPAVYLNFGISGAVQHMAGIRNAKKIISVNTDPSAPVFSYSDIAIVADWKLVAEKLLERPLIRR